MVRCTIHIPNTQASKFSNLCDRQSLDGHQTLGPHCETMHVILYTKNRTNYTNPAFQKLGR